MMSRHTAEGILLKSLKSVDFELIEKEILPGGFTLSQEPYRSRSRGQRQRK